MELYKLRYNLYNYLIHNTTNYEINSVNKTIWFYSLISYYTFFIFILLANYNKINLTIIIFIITGMFFLYYCYLLNNAITNIIDNEDFQNYVSYYKLFNAIYIDSYKNNKVNNLITDIQDVSDISISLSSIITTYYPSPVALVNFNNNNKESLFNTPNIIYQTNPSSGIKDVSENADYIYIEFKNSESVSTLDINKIDLQCDILLVGGGGGGGLSIGSGGGGGGIVYITTYSLTAGTYNIAIGSGGLPMSSTTDITFTTNGGNTILSNSGFNLLTALGGARGNGQKIAYENKISARAGGCGAGGTRNNNAAGLSIQKTDASISSLSKQYGYGYNGGTGTNTGDSYAAGGGGGGGTIGGNATSTTGGNGGDGKLITITGANQYYAGGGGGAVNMLSSGSTNGIGGRGGGGTGTNDKTNASRSGTVNTGGGGGGGDLGTEYDNSPGLYGNGGSGIVIIRFKKNILYTHTITFTDNNVKIDKRKNNEIRKLEQDTYKYLLLIVYNNNEHYFIRNLANNIYYKYKNVYYKLNKEQIAYIINTGVNTDNIGDFFIINIDNTENIIDKNPKFYNDLIQYLRSKHKIDSASATLKINALSNYIIPTAQQNSDYLNNFYNLIANIQTTVKNNENISIHDINNFIDDVIQNRDILRYIDIYDTSYDFLKKYIFIKNNDNDPIYQSINETYEINKLNKVSMLSGETKIIQDVIIKVLVPTSSTTVDYYLIDIQTINSYLNNKETNNDYSHINDFIVNIYNKLIDYYNKTYDLHIENFDILYKENKKIDVNIKDRIYIYNYLFNIIIAIIIIILTIIMHVFFINIYYNY